MVGPYFKQAFLIFLGMSISLNSLASTSNLGQKDYVNVVAESNLQINYEKLTLIKFYKQMKYELVNYKNQINNRSELRKNSLLATNLASSMMAVSALAKGKALNFQGKFVKTNVYIGLLAFLANTLDSINTAPTTEAEYIEKINSISMKIKALNEDNSLSPQFVTNMNSILETVQNFISEQYSLQTSFINIPDERRLALYTREAAVRVMIGFSAIWLMIGGKAGVKSMGFFAGSSLAMVSLLTSLVYDDVEDINLQIDKMLYTIDSALLSIE